MLPKYQIRNIARKAVKKAIKEGSDSDQDTIRYMIEGGEFSVQQLRRAQEGVDTILNAFSQATNGISKQDTIRLVITALRNSNLVTEDEFDGMLAILSNLKSIGQDFTRMEQVRGILRYISDLV